MVDHVVQEMVGSAHPTGAVQHAQCHNSSMLMVFRGFGVLIVHTEQV